MAQPNAWLFDEREMHLALEIFVQRYATQALAARELGISPQYLSDILTRRRDFGKKIAQRLGFVYSPHYEPTTAARVDPWMLQSLIETQHPSWDVAFWGSDTSERGEDPYATQ